eukprot:EC793606.1.p2 GENE.EC793606.1~~EC793606.1.p2  ORF type:complete len:130 (+),score=50.35 EC793606.1:59-448(+)
MSRRAGKLAKTVAASAAAGSSSSSSSSRAVFPGVEWQASSKSFVLSIRVTPKADVTEIVGLEEDEIRVRVAAVPDKGQANKELCDHLAKRLGVPKSNVTIVSGDTARSKRVSVTGCDEERLGSVLGFSG